MKAFRPALKPLALAVALATPAGAHAFQKDFDNGAHLSVDTTVSYGVSVRAENRDNQRRPVPLYCAHKALLCSIRIAGFSADRAVVIP